ncbi:MAG TPA: hypothetical protein VGC42_03575 [Kofleriaceae bacterium]
MTEPADARPRLPAGKPPLKERLKALFAEYGRVAIAVYFTLSILAIIGFSVAFGIGWSPTTASGTLGVIAAGWVAAKATLPIRILITLALTPMVQLVIDRVRRRKPRGSRSVPADDSLPPTVD